MKKLLSILLVFALLTLSACTPRQAPVTTADTTVPTETSQSPTEETTTEQTTEPEETDEPSSPVLYKATDSEGNVVYLMGSIHVGMDNMYPLPQYVLDAYNASDALAVEIDIIAANKDLSGAMDAARAMVLDDGTKISDHISEECYEKAVEILEENNTYYRALDMYKPVMWYSLISTLAMEKAGAQSDMGVDMYFLELAHDEDKTIYEIESVDEQYALLGGMSMELQALMLEQTVELYGSALYNMSIRLMCTAWASGDGEGLLTMTDTDTAGMSEEEAKLMEEFNLSLVGARNVNMTQYAEDALKSGETVFIVVGAAHVLGDDGMAKGLEALGYTVELVQ